MTDTPEPTKAPVADNASIPGSDWLSIWFIVTIAGCILIAIMFILIAYLDRPAFT